jgi:hypothetical protein
LVVRSLRHRCRGKAKNDSSSGKSCRDRPLSGSTCPRATRAGSRIWIRSSGRRSQQSPRCRRIGVAQFAYPKTFVVGPESLLFGRLESLKILIGYGADLFVAGEKGNIPLWTKQCESFDHVREVATRLAQSRPSERLERFAAAEAHAKEIYETHLRSLSSADWPLSSFLASPHWPVLIQHATKMNATTARMM